MSGILETFNKLHFSVGNEAFNRQPPGGHLGKPSGELIDEYREDVSKQLRAHRRKRPDFYKRFPYDWVLDPESYSDPLEMHFQLGILRVLADIKPSHPDCVRMRETAVRLLPTANVGAQCTVVEPYHFIILSTSFLVFIKETVGALWRLSRIGKRCRTAQKIAETVITKDHVFGCTAELAMRCEWEEAKKVLAPLIAVIFAYLRYEVPKGCSPPLASSMMDAEATPDEMLRFTGLYHPVEMFMVCHELGHLLRGHSDKGRATTQELEADEAGASLYIIHTALSGWPSSSGSHPMGYLTGPALFFQAMRLLDLCRRLVVYRESDYRHPLAELCADEDELRVRMYAMGKTINQFMLGGVFKMIGASYESVIIEFHILIAGVQKLLMQLLCGVERPIDEFLGRRSTSS